MKWLNRKWREDAGSIDFVQVVIGLMIVGIAAVGTFQALQFGNEQMNQQMRYRKAMSVARSYVEYWQGRIHVEDIKKFSPQELQGNLNLGDGAVQSTILDRGSLTKVGDEVTAYLRYGRLVPVDLPETGAGTDYWRIRVQVTWREPDQSNFSEPHRVTFDGTMVPAAL